MVPTCFQIAIRAGGWGRWLGLVSVRTVPSSVSVRTEFPIEARRAYELAQTRELFLYVTRGPMRFTGIPEDLRFELGVKFSARMWFLSVIPAWRHHGDVTSFTDTPPRFEIQTNGPGGPVKTRNHTLTFEERGPDHCLYTDTIGIESIPFTLPTRIFANRFFHYRQSRWRKLTKGISDS